MEYTTSMPPIKSGSHSVTPADANDVSYIARCVYGKLFRLAHGKGFDGVAQYRIRVLAAMLPYSQSAVEKALAELRRAGWIRTWTDGRKSFCIPFIALAPDDLAWIEDPRHAAVVPPDICASFSVPVRIRKAPGTCSSIRKNKSNQSKKKKQDDNTGNENAVPATDPALVVCSVSASHKDSEIEPQTQAGEAPPIHASMNVTPANPESKGEESIAAQLVRRLKAEGIRADVAAALMEHGERRVSRNITYVERSTEGKEVGNRAGYIRVAIEKDYAAGLDLSQVGVKAKPEGSRRVETLRAPKHDVSTVYPEFKGNEWDEAPQPPPKPTETPRTRQEVATVAKPAEIVKGPSWDEVKAMMQRECLTPVNRKGVKT